MVFDEDWGSHHTRYITEVTLVFTSFRPRKGSYTESFARAPGRGTSCPRAPDLAFCLLCAVSLWTTRSSFTGHRHIIPSGPSAENVLPPMCTCQQPLWPNSDHTFLEAFLGQCLLLSFISYCSVCFHCSVYLRPLVFGVIYVCLSSPLDFSTWRHFLNMT